MDEGPTSKMPVHRKSFIGGPTKSVERLDPRRGRDGNIETPVEDETDDIFESEYMMLKDLWQFDSVPFPVTKQVRATSCI